MEGLEVLETIFRLQFQRIPLFFSFYLTVSYLPMLITSLVLTGIGAILTILLLVGAFKVRAFPMINISKYIHIFQYKKWFLLPWMIEKAIHCLITLISTILIPIFSPLVIRMFLQKNEKNSLNELGVIAIIFSIEVISFISVGNAV